MKDLPPPMDRLCPYRDCYSPGENKGTFVQGRGYARYFDKPIPCCMTNLLRGCPAEPNVHEEVGEPDDRYRRAVRVMPDWDKVVEACGTRVAEVRATRKAKELMNELLQVVSEQAKLLGHYRRCAARNEEEKRK